MSHFPRPDYRALSRYEPDRTPVAVDLSDNTNLWGTHPAALEAVRGADPDLLARYPALYADSLKAAVARRFGVSEAEVCTGCGSDDVLDAAWRACATPGGVVRHPSPTFSMVPVFSAMNGRDARDVPWSAALDDPERLLEDDPVLVYVCRPENPTGALAARNWLDALLEAAARRPGGGPLVVVDEAYADYAGETLAGDVTRSHRVLVTRTLSKAWGLAGLRVGFGIGSPEIVDEVEKARGPYKVSRLACAAAVAALEDVEGWKERTVAEAVEIRERLAGALEARGLQPLPSRANFLLVPVAAGSALQKARDLRAMDVAVRPFTGCPDVGDALRVTVGPWPLIEAFLGALDTLLERDPEGWT